MTDRNKFEEMLERLVNEDREGAEELFHEIVVERSREIYENLLSEDTDEEVDEATDEEVDESEDELDESDDEDLDESDDELDESDDDEIDENEFLEADPEDDMTMDIEMPGEEGGMDMGMDMDMEGGDEEPATQGDIKDLEAELEALKADFDALVAGDMDEPEDDAEEMPMDMDSEEGDDDMDDEGDDDDMDDEDKMPFESKGAKSQTEQMREYVEKVSATMGDNGANTKSTVAKPNNMGGTSANIAKGGDGGTGGTEGGLAAPSTKEDNAGNVNVPGAKGATKMSAQPGHGAEKKGKAPEQDGSAGSPLNGAPKRAK
jgi:hypothetical protein